MRVLKLSHFAENVKGGQCKFVAKNQKNGGDPFGDIEKFFKKSQC